MLKYMYWRTAEPTRDWVGSAQPFDFHRADWNSPVGPTLLVSGQRKVVQAEAVFGPQHGGTMGHCEPISRRFHWLCGEDYPERLLGAQACAPPALLIVLRRLARLHTITCKLELC